MSNEQRKAVITIGLYQFIGNVQDVLALESLMDKLMQAETMWVHQKDNPDSDLPETYWLVPSNPRRIDLAFVNTNQPIISDTDWQHVTHIERRDARWELETEAEKELSDES